MTGFTPVVLPNLTTGSTEAAARGHAAGYAEGLRHAAEQHRAAEAVRDAHLTDVIAGERARTQQAVNALQQAASALNREVIPALEDVDQTLIEAALDLAEAVLGAEVAGGRVPAAAVLRRALDAAGREQVADVRMNPVDIAALDGTTIPDGITVTPDLSLGPGDATASLRHGWFDARIRESLDRARTVLTGGDR
jgi:flagellar assembly protein FliH